MFDVNGVSFKTRFLTLFASATLLVAFAPTVGMSPVSAAPVLAEGHNFVDSYWLAVGDQTPLGIDIDLTNTNQVVPVLALLKSLEIIGGSFSHTEISEVEEELIIALSVLTKIVSSIEGELK